MALLRQPAAGAAALDEFLSAVVRRLRATAAARGAGAVALAALLATALCVWAANRAAFSPASVAGSRMFLLAALAAVVVTLLILPLRRFMRGRAVLLAADEAERRAPEFGGRLRTWADERAQAERRGRVPSPLLALLARDATAAAGAVRLESIAPRAAAVGFAAVACFGVASLVWLGTAGPGYWRYGTARLWAGWLVPQGDPLYELQVEPGDATLRQGGRLEVTAEAFGFEPQIIEIFAKFQSGADWERAPMGPQLQASGFQFSFSSVREPLRYYVEAGRLRSPEFAVDVVVMPSVENIRLEYEYPAWSGLDAEVQDPGGDILAVPGTRVGVVLTTDKKLVDGLLVVGEDELPLRGGRAGIEVSEDSFYHVAAVYQGERVRLTEDYFITAVPDERPEVKILEPGRDWRASSIEEVEVRVEASDDFGLRDVQLRYAVNGREKGAVNLAGRRGAKRVEASHVFRLEDLGERADGGLQLPSSADSALPPPAPEAGLVPGDLVSYYLVAEDAKRETRSEMYFINVQPYARRFSQSQQAGMQGGQGQRQDEISRRQKEIILATWNLINEREAEDARSPDKLRESASMLSELQGTLMQQALTLVQRTRARQITDADPKFAQFAEYMEQAAGFMEPAAAALHGFELEQAVGPEQQALQFLLRAENLFTDIQISMSQGGGGGGFSRDLAEMFELEMDLEKNQYETGGGASGQQIDQEIDEAMRKLEELARRQERLADRARDQDRTGFEQRWRQEMLRREAEDLRRELEQLQRRQQGARQQAGARSGQSSSGRQSAGGGASGQSLDRAIQQLERAAREMERGSSGGNQRAASAGAQQQLQRAVDELRRQRRAQSESALRGMSEEAAALARAQEEAAVEMEASLRVALEALKQQGGRTSGALPTGMTRQEEIDLADRKQEIGERLAELEQGMQRQARMLRGQNEQASSAMLDALVEFQESQAATAIQYAAEMVRRGLAPYAASNEEAVSRALRRLRDNLREVGEAAGSDGVPRQRGLEGVLSEVERLRMDLERAAGESPRGPAQRPGEGEGRAQAGDPNQPGSRAGGGREGGQQRSGWAGGRYGGDGRWRGALGPAQSDPQRRERMEQALESAVAGVPRLVPELRANEDFDPRDIAALQRFARELGDGRFLGNPDLLAEEYRKMMALLEQLEVQLRRQVEVDDKDEVRAIVAETVPEAYRDAVAEYYRALAESQ